MGCRFCDTGRRFIRDLTADEMLAQVITARDHLHADIRNVVFMGMGEPLENFDNVVAAVRVLSDQKGMNIPQTSIAVSTVGHVPGLNRLAELAGERAPKGLSNLRVAVSINAPNDEIRSRIMPVNKKWPMAEIKRALRAYPRLKQRNTFSIGYVLLDGVNDAPDHARELASYLNGIPAVVNLIPYNTVPGLPWRRSSEENIGRFWRTLRDNGIPCRTRGVKGDGVSAACGQLGSLEIGQG